MKITINTDILKKHGLSLGEFLIMLMGYYGIDYIKCKDGIISRGIVDKNLFNPSDVVLSDNIKNLVAQILIESNEKVLSSNIDFDSLASSLQECYPRGNKPGTTYSFRGDGAEIAQKLRTLVAKYDFTFTLEEATTAVRQYVASVEDLGELQLLRHFILRTIKTEDGRYEMNSEFMTYIENIRENN